MALVASFEEVKSKQIRLEGDPILGTNGGMLWTDFFEFPDKPDLPHATLFHFDPGRVSHPHYHLVDQFQVVVGGKAKLGRRDIAAYGVHFSRGYTPYGPFISDPVEGLTCFVMHANSRISWRSRHLPAKEQELRQTPNRQPWQITFPVKFPQLNAQEMLLRLIPELEGESRLTAYTLSMKPNTVVRAPDPSTGEGQYLVVVKGSLLHDGKEHRAIALVFVGPREAPFELRAGSQGLEAMVLNYPSLRDRAPLGSA